MPELVTENGNCHFCGREVTSDDYCYGCGHYVCEECDDYEAMDRPSGTHNVEDHKKQ